MAMARLSGEAVSFLESWIADELLCKAPSGENEAEIIRRFIADVRAAGLNSDELDQALLDPDISNIVKKHSSTAERPLSRLRTLASWSQPPPKEGA